MNNNGVITVTISCVPALSQALCWAFHIQLILIRLELLPHFANEKTQTEKRKLPNFTQLAIDGAMISTQV